MYDWLIATYKLEEANHYYCKLSRSHQKEPGKILLTKTQSMWSRQPLNESGCTQAFFLSTDRVLFLNSYTLIRNWQNKDNKPTIPQTEKQGTIHMMLKILL